MDECQLAVNPKLIPLKKFDTEEECDKFVSEWGGEQLGGKGQLKNGKWCVAMPNVVSNAVSEAIKLAEKETKLRVPLGMEYVVNKDWYGCH